MNPAPTYYSYEFSRNAVWAFVEKHPRGCRNLAIFTNIEKPRIINRLVGLFQRYPLRWNSMKKVIKWMDDYDFLDIQGIPMDAKRAYFARVLYICEEEVIDLLESGELKLFGQPGPIDSNSV